jgi:hypothetical protein
MADIEDDVVVAQPAFPRTIRLVCAEAARDFVLYLLNLVINLLAYDDGEDAVPAQPAEHSRWIVMFLLFAAGIFTLYASYFLAINGYRMYIPCTEC